MVGDISHLNGILKDNKESGKQKTRNRAQQTVEECTGYIWQVSKWPVLKQCPFEVEWQQTKKGPEPQENRQRGYGTPKTRDAYTEAIPTQKVPLLFLPVKIPENSKEGNQMKTLLFNYANSCGGRCLGVSSWLNVCLWLRS